MFYRKPEPLNPETHGKLGVSRPNQPLGFLREAHAVPLTVSEFGLCANSYPIIFVGPEKTPVAVMGVRQAENLFVDPEGRVNADFYVPAFVRRYPFVFAADQGSDRLLLCVDTEAEMITDTPEMPFFENGQPTKYTQDAVEFCKEFERQRRATVDFIKLIESHDLFEEKAVTFSPRDANGNETQPQKIADYWAISEEKLNQLSAEKFNELRDNGAMGAIYAHLVSLLNWSRVIQRAMRTGPAQQTAGNA